MAGHVVDPDRGQAAHQGQGLGKGETDQQRADQARSLGGGDQVDVVQGEVRLGQGLVDHRADHLDVPPRGQLGHDAAEAGMDLVLTAHHRGKHAQIAVDHGGRGVVAGGFYGQDAHAPSVAISGAEWYQ